MLPILFSLGPVTFRTFTLFLILAFLGVAFLFWRKGREEHYEESQLFDGFLLATLFGFFMGRIGFIVLQFGSFGLNILSWLDIWSRPGFNMLVAILAASVYLYRYAHNQRWDEFEITDFWVQAVSFGLGLIWLGLLFDGSSFGYATTMPWGVVFPGVFEKHQPTQLFMAVFFFAQFAYLAWVEYRYRTFSWYRSGKNTAQTGFLTSMFVLFTGLFSFILSFFMPGQLVLQGTAIDSLVYAVMAILGGLLLFHRSGRTLPFLKR